MRSFVYLAAGVYVCVSVCVCVCGGGGGAGEGGGGCQGGHFLGLSEVAMHR